MNFVIRVYDSTGKFLKRIGEIGDVPGSFARPKGVAVDSMGNIYVVDANHDNFQIFNQDGRLLLFIGKNGSAPGEFILPSGIHIDSNDRIFIADTFNRRIQVFQLLKAGGNND
jgi:DNA-binding beta-propeller fold protein YncE